jgi:hypothetical protein
MASLRRLATVTAIVVAASTAAAAQPGPAPGSRAWVESLKAEWSRPVGGKTRFVGVEEYGRCSVFVDNGAVQVVAPSGETSWTWPFKAVSKYINPREVAVSHECDAIAFVGDASYKYVWIVDRAGTSASIKLSATPSDVEFDGKGDSVTVGTFSGTQFLYSRNGTLQSERQRPAKWASPLTEEPDDPLMSAFPHHRWRIAASDDGSRMWLRGEDVVECVDDRGAVLATIDAAPSRRGVRVSRDFGQVLIVTEKDLHPVSVERYVVPPPCYSLSSKSSFEEGSSSQR